MKYLYRDGRLTEFLHCWAGDTPLTCVGFFIWDRGKTMMHKSREGMVRSLLHQILLQHKQLIPVLFPEKWMHGFDMEFDKNVRDWTKPESFLTWDWSELFAALKLITSDLFLREQGITMRLCIFVDGMDEYRTFEDIGLSPNEVIDRKKQGYTEIVELFKQLAKSKITKVCLSSRHLVEFRDAFGGVGQQLKLEDLTHEDITSYTTDVLEKNHRWRAMRALTPILSRKLITDIVEKALGVFLWVVLVVHLLLNSLQDGDRLDELQSQLHCMPVDFGGQDGLYAHMMRNVKFEHRRQCFEMLQIVRHSMRPPTPLSLAFADGECRDLLFRDIETVLPLQVSHAQYISSRMDDRLNSRCAGLLESVGSHSTHIVQFMHQTAKDFVEQPEMWKVFLPNFPRDFNPYTSLLASCILELKLGTPLDGVSVRRGLVKPTISHKRVLELVGDALLYAFRDEERRLNQPVCVSISKLADV